MQLTNKTVADIVSTKQSSIGDFWRRSAKSQPCNLIFCRCQNTQVLCGQVKKVCIQRSVNQYVLEGTNRSSVGLLKAVEVVEGNLLSRIIAFCHFVYVSFIFFAMHFMLSFPEVQMFSVFYKFRKYKRAPYATLTVPLNINNINLINVKFNLFQY